MSEENDGAAYLAALRQSAPQAGGAAAARAPLSVPQGQTRIASPSGSANSPPADKRRSPRYRCRGSAQLRELSSGVATWVTFTDISFHGCYVEAISTFPVGSRLGLTMEVNGFRVESTGEVRVVYPNLGMGICFTAVSSQDRERLRELLRSLSRPSVILSPPRAEISSSVPQPDTLSPTANPALALKALVNFFEERHILGREEFLRILRKSQG